MYHDSSVDFRGQLQESVLSFRYTGDRRWVAGILPAELYQESLNNYFYKIIPQTISPKQLHGNKMHFLANKLACRLFYYSVLRQVTLIVYILKKDMVGNSYRSSKKKKTNPRSLSPRTLLLLYSN